MKKLLIAIFISLMATSCYPPKIQVVSAPTLENQTPFNTSWNCDKIPRRKRGTSGLKVHCERMKNGERVYEWLRSDDYEYCRRKRHCH